jgi:hypothetical protein
MIYIKYILYIPKMEKTRVYVVIEEYENPGSDYYYRVDLGIYSSLECAKQKLLRVTNEKTIYCDLDFHIREMILGVDAKDYNYIIHTYLEGEFISYELLINSFDKVPVYNKSLDDYYKSDFWYYNGRILAKLLHDYGKMNKPDFCNLINQNLSHHVPQIAELVDSYYRRMHKQNDL